VIGSLRGVILDRSFRSDQAELLVEVSGVGYRVLVPGGSAARAGELGGQAFLHVHTHVREDAIILYGFPSREERDCFETLLGAHGVGPALALALLSLLSPVALRRAVLSEDADALMLVPGIGRKTAARLIMELAPRFEAAGAAEAVGGEASAAVGPSGLGPGHEGSAVPDGPHEASAADRAARREEVRAALVGLGYGQDEVRQALARLPVEGLTEDLLRHALRELAGSR
jgi:Holliday junction DNA helicase RuvA